MAHALERFLARDGRLLVLRSIAPDDAPRLADFCARLSPETLRLRFFSAARPRCDEARLRHLTTVDFATRAAYVVCLEGDEAVRAVGRYETVVPHVAELALVVEDGLQRQGVGRRLLQRLICRARESDIAVFWAVVLPENRGMFRLLQGTGCPLRTSLAGPGEVEVFLDLGATHGG